MVEYSPLYICSASSLFSPLSMDMQVVAVLAVVNRAAMNTGGRVSFQAMFFSRYMPRSGIAGSYGSSVFSFLRNLHTIFSTVAVPIYIPTNSVRGFPSLHMLSSICCVWNFWWWLFWPSTLILIFSQAMIRDHLPKWAGLDFTEGWPVQDDFHLSHIWKILQFMWTEGLSGLRPLLAKCKHSTV